MGHSQKTNGRGLGEIFSFDIHTRARAHTQLHKQSLPTEQNLILYPLCGRRDQISVIFSFWLQYLSQAIPEGHPYPLERSGIAFQEVRQEGAKDPSHKPYLFTKRTGSSAVFVLIALHGLRNSCVYCLCFQSHVINC